MSKLKREYVEFLRTKGTNFKLKANEEDHKIGKSPYRKYKGSNIDIIPVLTDFLGLVVEEDEIYQILPRAVSLTGLFRILSYVKFRSPKLYEELKELYKQFSYNFVSDNRKPIASIVNEIFPIKEETEKKNYLISIINHLKENNLISKIAVFTHNKDKDLELINKFIKSDLKISDILKEIEEFSGFISVEDIPDDISDEIYKEIEGIGETSYLDESSFDRILNITEDDIREILNTASSSNKKSVDEILGFDDFDNEEKENIENIESQTNTLINKEDIKEKVEEVEIENKGEIEKEEIKQEATEKEIEEINKVEEENKEYIKQEELEKEIEKEITKEEVINDIGPLDILSTNEESKIDSLESEDIVKKESSILEEIEGAIFLGSVEDILGSVEDIPLDNSSIEDTKQGELEENIENKTNEDILNLNETEQKTEQKLEEKLKEALADIYTEETKPIEVKEEVKEEPSDIEAGNIITEGITEEEKNKDEKQDLQVEEPILNKDETIQEYNNNNGSRKNGSGRWVIYEVDEFLAELIF